jgi:DNA-binding transcriptional LysR family regulator
MLDLRHLATFREVATRGSFSAAAAALSFTQPAVSQHVAKLEKQIGTRLFDRDARGVRLTRAGDALLRHAEALLDAARRAEEDVRTEAGLHVPVVRVGAFATAAAGLVPAAFRELRIAEPTLRPQLRVLESEQAMDDLLLDRLDVGLLLDPMPRPLVVRDGIAAELLYEDPMLVALPAGHPLARRASVSLDELRAESWLMSGAGGTCEDSSLVLRACMNAGFEPDVRFESDDYNALQGLAAAGMGVALVPSLAAQNARDDVVLRPVAGQRIARRILLATRAGDDPAHITATLEALRLASRRLSLSALPAAA